MWYTGLAALQHGESSQIRDQTLGPCYKADSDPLCHQGSPMKILLQRVTKSCRFLCVCVFQNTLLLCLSVYNLEGYPGGCVIKNLPANAGVAGLIPHSGRSPELGNGNPLQYSWLENPTDRGAWCLVYRVPGLQRVRYD